MGETSISTLGILVHLVRPGVGSRDYRLTEGATLADLLRLPGAMTKNEAAIVGGVSPDETMPLRSGMVVTIVPRHRAAPGDVPWRSPIPALRDEELAREYAEILESRREASEDEGMEP